MKPKTYGHSLVEPDVKIKDKNKHSIYEFKRLCPQVSSFSHLSLFQQKSAQISLVKN